MGYDLVMHRPLERQVALVTGSTRGIGKAIAMRLAMAGCNLVIHGRSDSAYAQETIDEVQTLGVQATFAAADVGSKDEVRGLMGVVEATFGRLDVLVLNAARAPFKTSDKLLERDLRQLVATNFLGPHFCVQLALPLLKAEDPPRENNGRIVFISSLGSRYMNEKYPLGAMKAALEAQVRQWDEEFREFDVRANAICAGLVKTDAYKTLRRLWDELDRLPEAFFVQPEEVAAAVAFLAGPDSGAVRGQTLVVDRGLSNRLMRPIPET